jgi:hypothetical protein
VYGTGPLIGVGGQSSNIGVEGKGWWGVVGRGTYMGLYGVSNSFGVYGEGTGAAGIGVYGISSTSNSNSKGVYGKGYLGVHGESSYTGVYGKGGNYGVYAQGGEGPSTGVYANGDYGVHGQGGSIGVYGNGSTYGVDGISANIGVKGRVSNYGVYGESSNTGVYGKGGTWAGWFQGNVRITGTCCSSPIVTARTDHPLDTSKYVEQASILSPQQLGIYNGNATLDARGEAVVTLPAWFEAVYTDFRYTLTPIGDAAPNLHLSSEMKGNQFAIAGGKPGLKVSWQVSGVRHDKYAKEHPLEVEGLKSDEPAPVSDLPLPNPEPPQAPEPDDADGARPPAKP